MPYGFLTLTLNHSKTTRSVTPASFHLPMLLSRIITRLPHSRRISPLRPFHVSQSIQNAIQTKANQKPYYITTPIFYPNAKPHIGHLYTLVLGDVFARFRRLVEPGREVKLLVGTDEHGLKIQQAARAQGREEGEFVDALSEVFKVRFHFCF